MNIRLTVRHQKLSADEQDTIKGRFAKIEKFAEKISSCHIIIDSEHLDHSVEAVLNLQRTTVSAKAKDQSILNAADMTVEKIERQLKKINEKMKAHKGIKLSELEEVKEDDDEEYFEE